MNTLLMYYDSPEEIYIVPLRLYFLKMHDFQLYLVCIRYLVAFKILFNQNIVILIKTEITLFRFLNSISLKDIFIISIHNDLN